MLDQQCKGVPRDRQRIQRQNSPFPVAWHISTHSLLLPIPLPEALQESVMIYHAHTCLPEAVQDRLRSNEPHLSIRALQ